ncbi:MAG TPA: MlaD family protein [Thermoleophilaceae bacterium]|nr:MlaD family protein [Thermoleophilaceae bacterium]
MKRLAGIALLLVAIPLVVVFGTAESDNSGGGDYKVRAIFDFVRAVPGEDVKIAGAKVGTIRSLDVTPDKNAAVVLDIQKPGFAPFHEDAHCTIRPQSLIGETFADCSPGSSGSPELPKIQSGPGKGQHLLSVQHTSSLVDIDEINDIMREPTRERLAILINEFGTALAGRGQALNDAIHRANPALRDTDKVLAILAQQNRTLADLARNSDQVLTPLAAKRQQVADFIVQANKTAQATAERRADISAGIQRFPAFLRQLRPTLADLGSLSDQMTPVIRDLGTAAPGLNRFIKELGPFSRASIPALDSLGKATLVGRPALIKARPIATDLARFAAAADPVSKNLDALSKSLTATKGVDRLMDFLFFQMAAINGFDGIGHYLRAGLLVNVCSTYALSTVPGCSSNFQNASSSSAKASSSSAPTDPQLLRTNAEIRKALRQEQNGKSTSPPSAKAAGSSSGPSLFQRFLALAAQPDVTAQRKAAIQRIRASAGEGQSPAFGQADPALDYLLGP